MTDNARWCEAVVTLTGCDRDDAVEALRQMANTLVGSPCPLSAARRRVLDRLESWNEWSDEFHQRSSIVVLNNAIAYALSFR